MNPRTSIELITGELFDYADPVGSYDTLTPHVIAAGLSRQSRFMGQTLTEIPYSVAQHSVHVMDLAEVVMTLDGVPRMLFLRGCTPEAREYVLSAPKEGVELVMFFALMHDASESVFADMPSPAKRLPGFGEVYLKVEAEIMQAVYKKYALTPFKCSVIDEIVHFCDIYALTCESRRFLASRGMSEAFAWLPEVDASDIIRLRDPLSCDDAYVEFMNSLVDRIDNHKPLQAS